MLAYKQLALFVFSFFSFLFRLFWLLWLRSVRYGYPLLHCLMFRLMTGQSGHTASACQQSNSQGVQEVGPLSPHSTNTQKRSFSSPGAVLNEDIDQESLGCCLWSSPWMMQQNVFVWPHIAQWFWLCCGRLSLIIFFWLALLAVCVGASDVFPSGERLSYI